MESWRSRWRSVARRSVIIAVMSSTCPLIDILIDVVCVPGHDHTCKPCQRGLFQICEHEAINGVTMDGGYAEYVLLRTEAVVRVPTHVNPVEYAPILCAGITVFNSIRKQNILLGELVAIQGLGGLGHLAIQCE